MKRIFCSALWICAVYGCMAVATAQDVTSNREKIRMLMQEAQELAKLGDDEEAYRIRTKIAEMLEEQRKESAPFSRPPLERRDRPAEPSYQPESARRYQGPRDRLSGPPRPPHARHHGSHLEMALEHMRMAEHHLLESGMTEPAELMHRQIEEFQASLRPIHEQKTLPPQEFRTENLDRVPPRDRPDGREEQEWIWRSLQELREENQRLREMMRELLERAGDRNR